MKKSVFVLAIICFMTLTAQADVAKYCMSYSDFVAGNWKSVDVPVRPARLRAATTVCISRRVISCVTRY